MPYANPITQLGNRQAVVQMGIRGLGVSANAGFVKGLKQLNVIIPQTVNELMQAMTEKAIPASLLEKTNLRLAKEAQAAMVAGFHGRLPLKSDHYRPGGYKRRLTNTLLPALESEAMTANTTAARISFINPRALDSAAVHWYRVNYGAAGPNFSAGRNFGQYPITLGGHVITVLRDDAPPALHSWLPAIRPASLQGKSWFHSPIRLFQEHGFYWAGEQFWPIGGSEAVVPGHGSRAARFTDLGLETIAKRFGIVYTEMFRDYKSTEAGQIRLASKNIIIPPESGGPRPGT